MSELHAIVMAGGSGTRFWPASRRQRPKQILPLAAGEPLIRATVERLRPVVGEDRLWVITHAAQREAIAAVLPELPRERLLLEPAPRDTAPCVALATAAVTAVAPDATLAFVPSDHVVEPADGFDRLLRRGAELAADGTSLVTFGISPDRPATAYGYIELGPVVDEASPAAHRALRFIEKPDRATAIELVRAGSSYWNSGMFVWRTPALLAAMDCGNARLAAATRAMIAAASASQPEELERAFANAPEISIDYAVMESAPSVVVVRADLRWSDLGSFPALAAVAPADAEGNVTSLRDGARTLLERTERCTVWAEGRHAVALLGVRDLVVAVTPDAVLVCPRDRVDELKELVRRLPEAGLGDLL